MNIRLLDISDYAQCVDVIIDQKEFIETYWKEDYRYWVQSLSGWLHPEPFERFKGSFLDQNKKLVGFFHEDELFTFLGLNCYQRTDIAIHGYRLSKKLPEEFESGKVFADSMKFIFQWGVSIGVREFFGCRHPKLTKSLSKWIEEEEYFSKNFYYRVIATYEAYEIPTNNFHYEIMEFSPYAFPVDVVHWTYNKE